jgi:hypothetical protein
LVAATATAAVLGLAGPAGSVTPAPPEFYGVATSTDLSRDDFNRLARANIRTVRFTIYWPAVHNQAGHKHYWHNVDNFVLNAAAARINLIPTLIGTPKTFSEDPFRPPLDSESERTAWQGFVRSAVQRYGPRGSLWREVKQCPPFGWCHPNLPFMPIRVWQAWNEPNLGIFWKPTPSPTEYAELLELTGDAVHSVEPNAEVITGGIMPGGEGARNAISQNDFIARLYQSGVSESFDGVDLHPYEKKPKGVRRLVSDARSLMQVYGDAGEPLWVTEVGWSTAGPKDDERVTTRKKQGKLLSQTMKMLTSQRAALGLRLASWFTYRDAPFAGCDWCGGAGMLDGKLEPKPAWKKYVKVTGGQP